MKILILVDCQNDFIDGSLGTKEAQLIIPKIVKKIEEFNGDAIIITFDTHSKDYLFTKEGNNLPIEHCIIYTEGWKLNSDINESLKKREDISKYGIAKSTFGSYLDLPMTISKICKSKEEDLQIELVGLCTDICVISNALILKSYRPETTEITVDSNCCAGSTLEAHKAALLVMKSCQINII